jgi:RHS repeat-associated protein
MLMPSRKYSIANTNYRYGFNGKENDNDIENGAQDYGMRIYDGRTGRFLSIDPIASDYAFYSPYQFAGNKPIVAADLDGLEEWMKSQEFALKRQAEIRLRSAIENQPTIRAYNPADRSFTQKWRDSKNIFARVTYSMANGLYTFPQQMTATVRGSDFVYNIGGDAYHAHGMQDEKQRLNNFADFATTVMPGAAAETKGVSLFNKIAEIFLPREGTAEAAISKVDKFFESGLQADRNGLNRFGRALEKHAGRKGSSFSNIKFSHKTADDEAFKIVNDILSSKNKLIKEAEIGGQLIFDKSTGRGIGVSRNGEFNGFRDIKKEP